ncbi:MAG: RNA polymerase sigma factor [Chlorobiaceae bacterium]|nr:RNA polymerase sigma factor [Chlorobiaceae bacterium]
MTSSSGKYDLSQCSDQELVAGALRNKQAFAAIVRRYQAPLSRYIVRQGCRDNGMAQDLLQEVFIKVYLHLNDYEPSLPFSSWIYRIAHNETVSHFRKEKSRLYLRYDEFPEKMAIDLGLGEQDFCQSRAADLQAALAGLESRYRDIIILKFFEEKSYEEISDILQIPQGTVATLISRAKKKIKFCLEKR